MFDQTMSKSEAENLCEGCGEVLEAEQVEASLCDLCDRYEENDGQPTMWEEYQDLYGGDEYYDHSWDGDF